MHDTTTGILGTVGTGAATGLLSISPPVLFFFLGVIAVLVRSNIAIPKAATKLLSLYLLWAIGFKGGVELVASGFTPDAMKAVALALALSAVVPVWAYLALRRIVAGRNAAAIAACYGSVSVVTFLTACTALDQSCTPFSGHMVAVMALMESPAIVLALLLLSLDKSHKTEGLQTAPDGTDSGGTASPRLAALLHESLLNGPVLLLLGSIAVGVLTGQRGYAAFKPLCTDAFPGALAFFLLDLGLMAARRARDVLRAPKLLLAFAIGAPLVNAALAIVASKQLGIGEGDAILMAVLAASASYIAAPAALRLAIPRADPALYVSLSLGVTFPFNIILGIPLYSAVVRWWW
ncbi:MAG: sodium-dependent bicarbonate transport family permease [Pyrinomonadaceae bacterium]|nr:sodium-dependent bicarbonate transport family permease [Phycisphaerales bacterium]